MFILARFKLVAITDLWSDFPISDLKRSIIQISCTKTRNRTDQSGVENTRTKWDHTRIDHLGIQLQ